MAKEAQVTVATDEVQAFVDTTVSLASLAVPQPVEFEDAEFTYKFNDNGVLTQYKK